MDVIIIGGGIAGLTAAHTLKAAGRHAAVLEASQRAGGAIHSLHAGGYIVEEGPNSIMSGSEALDGLIRSAGVENDMVDADTSSSKRYVVREGRPVPLPSGPGSFLTSPLFSTAAKLRLLREPFIGPAPADAEETVAQFVRRRLGPAFLDYAINPFVAGIYAGDPEKLSVRHAFPKLHRLEQNYGSLIRGQMALARERKAAQAPFPNRRMYSFRDGLSTLPDALAARLGKDLHLNTRVTRIARAGRRWTVQTTGPQGERTFDATCVLLTSPLHSLPILDMARGDQAAQLARATYAPVAVVGVGFPRERVAHPLDGFGLLIPQVERRLRTLGVLFSSTLFPNRAPAGHVLLTVFAGGMRNPALAQAPDEELLRTVRADLATLFGAAGEPYFIHIKRWRHAIPQYQPGYGAVKAAIADLEGANAGFFLSGNFRSGISVSDTVTSASETAGRIDAFLAVQAS